MRKYQKVLLNLALVAAAVIVLVVMRTAVASNDDGAKGVICHATGSGHFNGIEVGIDTSGPLTIFSNNGHLDANGSPKAGHEDDFYLGPDPPFSKGDCPGGNPGPSPSPA